MASRPTAVERRRQVLVGELPENFLRMTTLFPGASQGDAAEVVGDEVVQQPSMYSFVPPNTRGRLSVTILEANLAKNYGLVRMDPYCRLRVGHAVFETQTKMSGGRSPFWNRIVHAWLPLNVESIYLQVFDEKAFSADECVAHAHIMLPPSIFNGDTIDEFYPLNGQQGEGKEGMIHLIISFSPMGLDQQQQQVQPAAAFGQEGPHATALQAANVITEEELASIQEMFPDIDPEVIRVILEENRGNQDAAVTAILELTK